VNSWRICCVAAVVALVLAPACGRYFPTSFRPVHEQVEGMTVNDDGSITYDLERLAITLRPMTDEELNRLVSPSGNVEVNPYTFGELTKPGENWTPSRFTVFRLEVANYQFPKVRIDPDVSQITASNRRQYDPLSFAELYEYYRAHWVGRTGQGRTDFRTRTDVLNRTMFSSNFIFSGTDADGYIVFPRLDDDVTQIDVDLNDIAVRFDYADEPVEQIDLTFRFGRDILRGNTLADAVKDN
jgi:hypothetical protein